MTFDCNNCLLKCKAICCQTIPLPNAMFEKHEPIRPILILVDREDGTSTPTTADGYCPFLGLDLRCSVYEDRPGICKVYGKGGHFNLECEYQAPDGRIRTRGERRQIEHKVQKGIKKMADFRDGKRMIGQRELRIAAMENVDAARKHLGKDFNPFTF